MSLSNEEIASALFHRLQYEVQDDSNEVADTAFNTVYINMSVSFQLSFSKINCLDY